MEIKAIRGTKDILPGESKEWSAVENTARDLFAKYGYEEIRTPIVEDTALFKRSIGDTTDIVQKQMYTFQDRGERSITLRPEGTAPVVRAYLENNINNKQGLTKLFYMGPMFRAERPQAGRQRQFHQIGVEAIGSASPYLDAEIIALLANFLKAVGVKDFTVKINSLGCCEDKDKFSNQLKKDLKSKAGSLCDDCKVRFNKNVFRVLDCKNPECKKIVHGLLKTNTNLCDDCSKHFAKVKEVLDFLGIKYTVDNHLVRGLDYYTGTVFEVVPARHCEERSDEAISLERGDCFAPPSAGLAKTEKAQDAIAAGGRYDNLIKDLGGPDVPAIGFAIGIERLLMASGDGSPVTSDQSKIYIAALGETARKKAFELGNELRKVGIICLMEYDEKSLKSQLKAASNQGCKYAVILGDDELNKNKIILRNMSKSEQEEIEIGKIVEYVKKNI